MSTKQGGDAQLVVREGDDFIQTAFEFAQKHGLDTEQAKKIYTLIKQAHAQHLNKLRQSQ